MAEIQSNNRFGFNVSGLWVVVGVPIGQQIAISKTNFIEKS